MFSKNRATLGSQAAMLNLAFIFDDAIRAVTRFASWLEIPQLPATVHMMQTDVINHYVYALDHYLTLTLREPFLQYSSIGTPYEKWAYFTNEDFGTLSFAIHNLLRYTSRLHYESERRASERENHGFDWERTREMARIRNGHTRPIGEIRQHGKSIGVAIHSDHRLSITAIRTGPNQERVTARWSAGSPKQHYRLIAAPDGSEVELPIEQEEYEKATETVRTETIDIEDRSKLSELRKQGHAEVKQLSSRNQAFGQVCKEFYKTRVVAKSFKNLNQSFWI